MFSLETQAALVDGGTASAWDSIYSYQAENEVIKWHYGSASYYAPYQYFEAVQAIVQTVDNLIDLDFEYTSDYSESDYDVLVYDYKNDGTLGTHTDYVAWGQTEVFYDPWSSWQSNVNTFVHEFGHYLGLGEPGWDWRFDQSDTAMSYNSDPVIYGGYQTFFTANDQAVLLGLHGRENDPVTGFLLW